MSTLLYGIEVKWRNLRHRLKGAMLKAYLVAHGCKVGKGLRCRRWPLFRFVPAGNIAIGDNVGIGYCITLAVCNDGRITIGNNVSLTHNVLISAVNSIAIGDHCLIAENVTIRDQDHRTEPGKLISEQDFVSSPVIIGRDVWIGAGCAILKGSTIPDGVIIGANSVVTASTELKTGGIYAGIPAKFLRFRQDEPSSMVHGS